MALAFEKNTIALLSPAPVWRRMRQRVCSAKQRDVGMSVVPMTTRPIFAAKLEAICGRCAIAAAFAFVSGVLFLLWRLLVARPRGNTWLRLEFPISIRFKEGLP